MESDSKTPVVRKRRRWTRRILLSLLAIFLIGGSVGGGYYAYWVHVECRIRTISEGKVYQSAAMPLDTLKRTVEERGIRTVIDFRRNDSGHHPASDITDEKRLLESMGVKHVHLSSRKIPTKETINAFIRVMDVSENYPVLIHCYHGLGKSRVIAAIYLIEFEGWSNEDARRNQRWFPEFGEFARDQRKGQLIEAYVPRRRLN